MLSDDSASTILILSLTSSLFALVSTHTDPICLPLTRASPARIQGTFQNTGPLGYSHWKWLVIEFATRLGQRNLFQSALGFATNDTSNRDFPSDGVPGYTMYATSQSFICLDFMGNLVACSISVKRKKAYSSSIIPATWTSNLKPNEDPLSYYLKP